jgi:trk system potassium uptake protein TrkA
LGVDLDVQLVLGSGTSPAVLADAGVGHADLVAAVTDRDETNLLVCQLAKQLGAKSVLVRLQSEELRGEAGQKLRTAMGADMVIDPDADTADEILELIGTVGVDELYPLAGGELILLGATVAAGAPIEGRHLAEIADTYEPDWRFLFGAVTRKGTTIIPRGNQQLLVGDHVRVITQRDGLDELRRLLGLRRGRARRVMVLGGGSIGARVAERLQEIKAKVVLIERDPTRARALAERLPRVTVIEGDITDTDLLTEESVGSVDAVVATTGEDPSNVLACAYAAAEGARFTVVVLHRLALLPLVARFGIDASVSPRTASANAVLRYFRGGLSTVTFLESDTEVDEIEVREGSRAVGVRLADLHLPVDFLVGAIIREGGSTEIARGRTVIKAGDHLVVFARPAALARVRKVFAP